ncbi:BON domain-containing protein [Lichenihabitans psoromatis]|uniref:BON domain-containing protein n=1 Tax=Lichenihabitans psoromatis TaxID=2528642 RepID=UPI001FDF6E54|nr:BON domain-containing protein [Lichenihabitans psoromatis]
MGSQDEQGRSAAQGLTGTKRTVGAEVVEVTLKGTATDAATARHNRQKEVAPVKNAQLPCASWGDADIAATAAGLLAWHSTDCGYKVLVTVNEGWATLSGHVDWDFQKDAVEQDVRRLLGVIGVTSTIETQAQSAALDRRHAISRAARSDIADAPVQAVP